jgi:hypothetical protein
VFGSGEVRERKSGARREVEQGLNAFDRNLNFDSLLTLGGQHLVKF